MKVILLRDVKGVGRKFEEKDVSDGYAANFLLPRKLAVPASGAGAAEAKELKKQSALHKEKEQIRLKESLAKIAGRSISVKMKANEQGHLFASLNAEKVSKLLKEEDIDLPAENIALKEPIKKTGAFEVPVYIAEGVETRFSLKVEPA